MLEVKNLTLYIEKNKTKEYLLNNICFSLNNGESLGIIGKSGAGKSTLAKALLKIYDNKVYPETCDVLINNMPFKEDLRGKTISILFQNPNSYLNPLMKIGKQIDEMLIYHFKLSKKEAKQKTIELMKKVNFSNPEKLYHYYPHEISGGMQQKVCLCIALICNPQILIIDEGTSYLDPTSKKEILTLIKQFQKEINFTLIMISHDLNEIYSMCDKIAIMRNGQMIELGSKDEIILNPIHPYTIEILCDYLRFYENIEPFVCPLMNIDLVKVADITTISQTHYVRSHFLDKRAIIPQIPDNFNKIKEKIYENLRDEKHKYIL